VSINRVLSCRVLRKQKGGKRRKITSHLDVACQIMDVLQTGQEEKFRRGIGRRQRGVTGEPCEAEKKREGR
jgi:hypothetical protein